MVDTPSAAELLPVSVDPPRADVPKEAFAKTAVKAVALSVREASLATWNNWLGLSATKALTLKLVSTLTLFDPGQ